jgi:hypothetical protein
MAMVPMRRNPLTSMLDFAAERNREAASLGSVISQIAKPALSGMGVQTDEMTPQPAVMRGPVPAAQPLGPMTGPAMAPTPVMSKEELKANVFPGESGGDYNALFGYSNRPGGKFEGVKLTDMTVNEVAEFTDPKGPYGQWVKDQIGYVATPTGAFQTVGTTLKDAMRGLGLTGDEPYDQNTQDAIGMWIYENQGPEAWEGWNKGTMTAGGGGDARLGGGSGTDTLATPESIFAGLYDAEQAAADEKKAKRKDFFAAVSQGFSALSQGRPIDFSNIAANAQERRKAAAAEAKDADMRRIAATYMLNRYNDPEAARAVATGALGINDILSMREQDQLYTQRAAQIEATEAGQNAIKKLVLDRGGSQEEADAAAAAPEFYLNLDERQTAADKADAERIQKEEELAGMNVTAQRWLQSDDPGKVSAAEEFLALPNDAARSGYDLFARAKDYATKEYAPTDTTKLWREGLATAQSNGPDAEAAYLKQYPDAVTMKMKMESTAGTGQFGQTSEFLGTGTLSGQGVPLPTIAESAPDSVFNRASDATGLLSAAAQLGANTIGQASEALGFGGLFQEEVGASQALNIFKSKVVGALGSSERGRMLAQELAMLIEEVAPAPGVFVSPETMRTRLTEIDAELRSRLAEVSADVNDTTLPAKDREDARRLAAGIESAIRELHAPSGVDGEDAPIPEVGETVEVGNLEGAVIVNEDGSERPLKAGEQPKPGDTVRLSNGVTIEVE